MKRVKFNKYIHLLFFSLLVLILAACSEDLSDEYFDPKTPEISADQSVINVPKEGGEFTINVTSNLPWRAEAKDTWVSLEGANDLQSGVFKMAVGINRTLSARETEILLWITSDEKKSIKVIQAPSEASDLVEHYYVKEDGQINADGKSWETATTLENALDKAMRGDFIHLAAGTYSPTRTLTNGNTNDSKEKTFEIHSNITMIGGYSADATGDEAPDPENNETILSGLLGTDKVFHVVSITAPVEAGQKVTLKGLTIRDGQAAPSGTGSVSVNGAGYYRFYGGGVIVARSVVDIIDCNITDNASGLHAAGMYIFTGATVRMVNSTVQNSAGLSTGSNGGGIFVDASTLYLIDSKVINNGTTGVGAGIYSFNASSPTYTYIYNSLIAGNNNNLLGTNATRKGGGFYGRENSVTVMVNTTIHGNIGGVGAGLALHGPSGSEAKLDLVSCTVTGNVALTNHGGYEGHANCVINFHNSIVSGNGGAVEGYHPATFRNSIFGSTVYGADKTVIPGLTFDHTSMIGTLEDNGGKTRTCLLTGSNNPALTNGMSSDELKAFGEEFNPPVEEAIITNDQIGLSRVGKTVMGACVK
ncbi:BACON domain-containing protein [Proteiniphilum saccharofermentans]|uniref:BACON domain-containing protein n=1 Tax=Proteiniphilum saccharofermentans TaxID=1642647 RepID=UPI0028ABE360|nr:BACON domain-containing protein [Proteiniphilum saccharofermentans]